jgi:hypothetical protein
MAALGYDWELDFNTLMDAAYKSEFATNVVAFPNRRSYLFLNAATKKPVFEYRGAFIITPGCDIESYTASLVCVTRGEQTKYSKDIKCMGKADCPCLDAPPPVPPINIPAAATGGRLTQSNPTTKSFHEVADNSAYVYDHLRVELNGSSPK